MGKKKKAKLPKEVLGVKLPKEVREVGGALLEKANSPQGRDDWYLPSSSRIHALSVWSRRRLRLPITPSNGFLTS